MKRHISTVVVFFTSLLGFVCLGIPFMASTYNGIDPMTGYDFLKDLSALQALNDKKLDAGLALVKAAVIILIVLFCIAIVFNIVKLLRDLNVIKIKSWAWTEWTNLALLVLITLFAIVALCGVSGIVSGINAKLPVEALRVAYGVISTVVLYVLALAVDIAWVVLRTIKARKEK